LQKHLNLSENFQNLWKLTIIRQLADAYRSELSDTEESCGSNFRDEDDMLLPDREDNDNEECLCD
jgi:hypothetical protein